MRLIYYVIHSQIGYRSLTSSCVKGGGYTPDFIFGNFWVWKHTTDVFDMLGSFRWFITISVGFSFNFNPWKNFQLFSFWGNPRRKKIFFSRKLFFQNTSSPRFFNIFSKFQKEVLDNINGHLTTDGISSTASSGHSTFRNVQSCCMFAYFKLWSGH